MFDQEDSDLGVVIAVVFGVIALVISLVIGPWLNALLAWGSVVVLVGLGLAARRRSPRNAKTPTP